MVRASTGTLGPRCGMTGDPPFTRDELIAFVERGQKVQAASSFIIVAAELRALGLSLARSPEGFRVNLIGGPEQNALTAETLDDALELGRDMAATLAASAPAATSARAGPSKGRSGKRRRRPRRMTPKAYNKRMRMAQLRKMRARAIREQRAKDKEEKP